jgi:hypothetical protein
MYLLEARVLNDGPLVDLNLTIELNEAGVPKPMVVVGENGTGKTNLLSIFADAIIEGAAQHHSDVVAPSTGVGRHYLRIVGGLTLRRGATGGFALIRFDEGDKSMIYAEKAGTLDPGEAPPDLSEGLRSGASWPAEGSHKSFPVSEEDSRRIYSSGCYAYFPASRSETPHWLNQDSLPTPTFTAPNSLSGRLGKSLFVERGMSELAQWVSGLILDSRTNLAPSTSSPGNWEIQDWMFLRSQHTQDLANRILQIILDDSQARFVWPSRYVGLQYTTQSVDGTLPLSALSSGQATLLSVFGTVLRQCDAARPFQPESAPGICVIDEIDAHVHVDLAFRAIPKLLSLLPAIQFITSAHSPLYVLGMQAEFGDGGMQVLEMPSGRSITAEGYREFGSALEVLKETQGFDAEVARRIDEGASPLILCEGETDPKYLRTAVDLLGLADVFTNVTIDWVGTSDTRGGSGAGKDALWRAWQLLTANPDIVGRPILLLFDNDAQRGEVDNGPIGLRTLQSNMANARMSTGIENLLPEGSIEDRFYAKKIIDDKKGKFGEIRELDKTSLCAYLCDVKRDPNDFTGFVGLLETIRVWLDARTPLREADGGQEDQPEESAELPSIPEPAAAPDDPAEATAG